MISLKQKFKSVVIIALASMSIMTTPVYAYDDYSSSNTEDSIIVNLLPVIVPTVTVGGMILSSRTKKKNTSALDYIELKVISSDEENIGKVKTVESPSKNKYEKTSYVKNSDVLNNGKTVINALSESLKKNDSNPNGGASGQ